MTDAEVEIVAEELAKIGGTSWYPGRESSSILRVISDRYRDRARAAIAALDRYRAQHGVSGGGSAGEPHRDATKETSAISAETITVGDTVVYRPPEDRRAYSCTVEATRDGEAYLVLNRREGVGWVPIPELLRAAPEHEAAARKADSEWQEPSKA